jgi:two-component system response regulator HydG
MPILRIIEGFGSGQSYDLGSQRTTIGRDAPNPIQIGDPKSSRVHAELSVVSGRWQVKDLGSSNGTWNEDGRISSMPLVHGAVFRIGATYFRFESQAESGDATIAEDRQDWSDPAHLVGLDQPGTGLFRGEPQAGEQRDLARAKAYLVLLHQLVLQSNKATSRDQLFELLDDAAAEVLEGDRCAVFLPAPNGEHGGWVLWPTHERRLRARFGAVPFARTLLAAVRARKEPLLCTSEGDLEPSASMVQSGVRSAMAAPLRIGDELHAALYVDRIAEAQPFTRAELEFLAAAANQLAVQLHNRASVAELEAEVVRLKSDPKPSAPSLIGADPAMKAIAEFIARAAPTDAPVLILGESGTGKELIARAIHAASKRSGRPLQVTNCAALAESLIESTLFGHVKGAFTGADESRPGLFELADQATLVLDEVGELPLGVQAKLLRALEQGEVQRVGDGAIRRVNVRVIAATNRDLGEEVKAGRFRGDLLHRLDVLTVTTPPLRARPADIDVLIDHFLHDNAHRLAQPLKRFAPEARAMLLKYHWPGNVRQLKNVVERACIMAPDKVIQPADLPESLRGPDVPAFTTPIASLGTIERAHILRVLEHCGGNKKAAAELLEIDRSTLYAKLRQYGQA